jgi:hypothetical protein
MLDMSHDICKNVRPFYLHITSLDRSHIVFRDALSRHFNARHVADGAQRLHNAPTQKVQMACVHCGKAKVRCTGTDPCQRCVTNGIECRYSEHRRATRAQKRRQQGQHTPRSESRNQQENHAQEDALETASNDYTPSGHASAFPLNLITQDEPMRDQSSVLYGNEGTALRTPYLDLPLFDIPPDFGCGFGDDLGDTMPPLSGIEWAMLDLPLEASGFIVDVEPGEGNFHSQLQDDNCQATDTSETQIEPRQFRISNIMRDAPLRFPDMEGVNPNEFDDEDRAHVGPVEDNFFTPLLDLASKLQVDPFHPPFERLVLPPAPVMNIFIQLYFEYFHSLVPILHKPTFSSEVSHWLLVFTVAAIGSRYSKISGAKECSLAMLEVVRRLSAYMVSTSTSLSTLRLTFDFHAN